MREVVHKDRNGYLRRVLIRDDDPESMAQYGIPVTPDIVAMVDWDEIKRQINNIIVEQRAVTHMDAQRTRVFESVANVVRRYVDLAYREYEKKKSET